MRKPAAKKVVRVGTRGSLLAMAQAGEIKRKLEKKYPKLSFRLVVIQTRGDEFQVGVFTKAIEEALLKNRVDIAVHSLKDLPTELPKGLCLAAFPKRLDPGDVLISKRRYTLQTLPKNAVVGTGSPRRKRQIQLIRPDLCLADIRGNLDTRVRKVIHGKKYAAAVVAKAGLKRLKKYLNFAVPIPLKEVMPAVGQAALGIETRKSDRTLIRLLKPLNDPRTKMQVCAERRFLKELRGGCRVPVGILSEIRQNKIRIRAAVFSTRSEAAVTGEIRGPASQSEKLAAILAKKLLKKGAGRLLREARS